MKHTQGNTACIITSGTLWVLLLTPWTQHTRLKLQSETHAACHRMFQGRGTAVVGNTDQGYYLLTLLLQAVLQLRGILEEVIEHLSERCTQHRRHRGVELIRRRKPAHRTIPAVDAGEQPTCCT